MSAAEVTFLAATVGNGLLAGVFLAFACAVTLGLRHVDDRCYVSTFRAINTAILNGWFLGVFLVSPVVTAATVVLHAGPADRSRLPWLAVGLAAAAGTVIVTAAVNVPLNRRLGAAPVHTDRECTVARRRFERRWNRWNLLRTVMSTLALVSLVVA